MISRRYLNDGSSILNLTNKQNQTKSIVEQKFQTGQYQFERVKCSVCEKERFETLAEKDRYGLFCPIVICKDCGLIQLNPRMTEESYNQFYFNEYRNLYMSENLDKVEYFQSRIDAGKNIYKYLKNVLPKDKKKSDLKLLDVGCGIGGIVKFFSDLGFETLGIDLGEEFINYGKAKHNLNLKVTKIVDINLEEKYDVIIYSHVFEHLLDLDKELSIIKSLLSEDGFIYVEVPGLMNSESFNINYKGDFLRFHQNAHTYVFTQNAMNNVFNKNGFLPIKQNNLIQAVFKPNLNINYSPNNEYEETMKYLLKAEKYQSWYPLTPYNILHLPKLLKKKLNF